jgi:hypothetical protein
MTKRRDKGEPSNKSSGGSLARKPERQLAFITCTTARGNHCWDVLTRRPVLEFATSGIRQLPCLCGREWRSRWYPRCWVMPTCLLP